MNVGVDVSVYRLILAPLYSPGFLNVLFICMSLAQMGTRLEVGSCSLLAPLALTCWLLWVPGARGSSPCAPDPCSSFVWG